MKKLLLLTWIIPAYLIFLSYYETSTWLGIRSTNQYGEPLVAQVIDLTIKNLQAQSNGRIEIEFVDSKGLNHSKKMSLPVQLAAQLQTYAVIPIRYLEDSSQEVVFVPTAEFHSNMVLMNMAICYIGALFTIWVGIRINKFIFKQSKTEALDNAVQEAWAQLDKGNA